MPRPARLFTALLLGTLLLSACSPASPLATPTATKPATPAASLTPSATPTLTPTPLPTLAIDPASLRGVTIRVWQAFSGPANDLFTRQAAEFTSSNEWGIRVESQGYGDYNSLFDAVSTSLDSGNSPDLVAALPDQSLAWDDAVVDLAPYLADPTFGLTAADLADIPSIFMAQDNVNGKVMGLPAQRSARFLFYNKTWAGQLGFNDPPTNSAEFHQQACAANASFSRDSDPTNDGYGGLVVDSSWQSVYSWILAFNGGVVDGDTYTFRTDPNLKALEFLKGLYDDHCAWISTEPTPFDSFSNRSGLFISADLASLPLIAASMAAKHNTDQWELIPFPGPQERAVVAYGPSYTVLKSTPEKQLAAWLFARWLLSPDSQAQWVQATGLLPLRISSQEALGAFRTSLPQWEAAVQDLEFARDVPQLASWRKVRYMLQDGIDTMFQQNLSPTQLPSILMEMDTLAAGQK